MLTKRKIQKIYKMITGYTPWTPILRNSRKERYVATATFNKLKYNNKKYMLETIIEVCQKELRSKK